MRALTWLAVLAVIVLGYPVHGYLYTVYSLQRSAAEYGVYPTLDEAIARSPDPNALYYRNVKATSVYRLAGDPATPFIRQVLTRYLAESHADGSPIRSAEELSSYFVHTRDGWLRYRGELWVELGGLADWMKFYRLHGEDGSAER